MEQSHRQLTGTLACFMAVLALAGCGSSSASPGGRSSAPPATQISPQTLPPVTPSGVAPSPGPTGPASDRCPQSEGTIEPETSCRVDLRVGATVQVRLRTPYPTLESFKIARIAGAAARTGEQTIDRDGNNTFTLSGMTSGMSVITAAVPGPADAPGKTLTLTVMVAG